jgi:ElaB/YqjD/DUF883 family membrane-anchored ribosome-binding protein
MHMMTTNEYANGTLDQTRKLATQAMERAGDKFRDLGLGVKEIANKGMGSMSGSAAAAQRQLAEYASTTGRYVTERPLRSALIAAAVGAAVAGLIIALRRSRSDDF